MSLAKSIAGLVKATAFSAPLCKMRLAFAHDTLTLSQSWFSAGTTSGQVWPALLPNPSRSQGLAKVLGAGFQLGQGSKAGLAEVDRLSMRVLCWHCIRRESEGGSVESESDAEFTHTHGSRLMRLLALCQVSRPIASPLWHRWILLCAASQRQAVHHFQFVSRLSPPLPTAPPARQASKQRKRKRRRMDKTAKISSTAGTTTMASAMQGWLAQQSCPQHGSPMRSGRRIFSNGVERLSAHRAQILYRRITAPALVWDVLRWCSAGWGRVDDASAVD
jgi:hypothetical protein